MKIYIISLFETPWHQHVSFQKIYWGGPKQIYILRFLVNVEASTKGTKQSFIWHICLFSEISQCVLSFKKKIGPISLFSKKIEQFVNFNFFRKIRKWILANFDIKLCIHTGVPLGQKSDEEPQRGWRENDTQVL